MAQSIPYTLIRKRVKHLRATINSTGELIVTSPLEMPSHRIETFISTQHSWFDLQRKKLATKRQELGLCDQSILIGGKPYQWQVNKGSLSISSHHRICYSPFALNSPEAIDQLRKYARPHIGHALNKAATTLGISYNKLSIRDQKTRWGSCSSLGNISINWRVIQLPEAVSNYVLIHELCHRLEMNHSKKFWALVAEAAPNFIEAEAWLKNYGYLILQ